MLLLGMPKLQQCACTIVIRRDAVLQGLDRAAILNAKGMAQPLRSVVAC